MFFRWIALPVTPCTSLRRVMSATKPSRRRQRWAAAAVMSHFWTLDYWTRRTTWRTGCGFHKEREKTGEVISCFMPQRMPKHCFVKPYFGLHGTQRHAKYFSIQTWLCRQARHRPRAQMWAPFQPAMLQSVEFRFCCLNYSLCSFIWMRWHKTR